MTKFEAILTRFLKGFVASAIPTIVAALAGITAFQSTTELKTFLIGLGIPLATGALLALQKAYSWEEPEQPVEIDEVKSRSKKS